MDYIELRKKELVNLEYSLTREILRSNRAGAYASSTIINCNTRKYHGLLVVPQAGIDDDPHVLLSSLDETIIQHDAEFNLGIHKYDGETYNPKGHKYIRDYTLQPIPKITYRVGGVVLTRELILLDKEDRVLIRYTLVDAHSPTKLRLKPFLAFRNVHFLTHANNNANTAYDDCEKGIKMRMYPGYSNLYMQFNKDVDYVHVPDWYYNIEYQKERDRGYDCHEDLLVPGFFETEIKKGESIVFSAGIREAKSNGLKRAFAAQVNRRTPRNSFQNCMNNAAEQFIVKKEDKTYLIAGFPYFGMWSRDTFIALPGITLSTGNEKLFLEAVDTVLAKLNGALFPSILGRKNASNNSVDAPLWFFWAMQQYLKYKPAAKIWKKYGKAMKQILKGFKEGTEFNIEMTDEGLISAGQKGAALTWMDAVINQKPVTPRMGMPVEVNALWLNAVSFAIELARGEGENDFADEWQTILEKGKASFNELFWDDEKGYLADCITHGRKDWSVRPNQLIAASLPYSALSENRQKAVVSKVKKELLTPRGIRTLSPKNPAYKSVYYGNQQTRDNAYHNGIVFPWLMSHFTEAYLRIHGKSGLSFIKDLYEGFEEVLFNHGMASISEVYDGDPPYRPGGAISQAWSVAAMLQMKDIIDGYEA